MLSWIYNKINWCQQLHNKNVFNLSFLQPRRGSAKTEDSHVGTVRFQETTGAQNEERQSGPEKRGSAQGQNESAAVTATLPALLTKDVADAHTLRQRRHWNRSADRAGASTVLGWLPAGACARRREVASPPGRVDNLFCYMDCKCVHGIITTETRRNLRNAQERMWREVTYIPVSSLPRIRFFQFCTSFICAMMVW